MAAKATRESFGETILELAATNENLVVLDADLSKSTMTQPFMKKYPHRHFEMGIAEQNMIGVAAGLALSGKIPVLTSFACFLIGRVESIRVSAAYNQTNMKLVGTHAGIGIGEDGTSQMGLEDVAAMRALPHMTVLQPADHEETRQAVRWMIEHKGPVYIRLTRQKMPDVHGPDYKWQPNKIDVIYEPANKPAKYQATIIASGGPVPHAVEAAKRLEAKGFAVRVDEKIREGEKERVQMFEGLIISLHRGKVPTDNSFTVRRIVEGVGVEKVFPLFSPNIVKIHVA